MRLDVGLGRRRAPVEVVGERPEHRGALGREVVDVDVRPADGHPQPGARPRDDLHHRTGADAELGADLVVGAALDVAHGERAALAPGQDRRATAHEALLLSEQHRPFGVSLEVVVCPDRRLDLTVGDLVGVAQLLPEDVPGGRVQVRADVHGGRRLGKAREEADEHLLHEVVRRMGVARQAQTATAQFRCIGLVQSFEGARAVGGRGELAYCSSWRHVSPSPPRGGNTGLHSL